MKKIPAYIDEVVTEMRKVNWPKRPELISNTVITLIATAVLSLYIFGVDRVIAAILDIIY